MDDSGHPRVDFDAFLQNIRVADTAIEDVLERIHGM